ncbi:MAG TPA: 30S ribosomal protein S20 [Oligoflexia bacterium]|nr:30S ribosomal protein S20 [Oligoflexia bacterium]HMP49233.1 30S ribosomal protein S20 [Oligoflexia bacterium]
MANHASALKRHRQSLKRRDRNRTAKSAIRTAIKKISSHLEKGEKDSAVAHAKVATKLLDKAAIHGIIHKNAAARTISRISLKISQA